MNKILFLLIAITIIFSSCTKNKTLIEFKSNQFQIGIDTKGSISQLTATNNNTNFLAADTIAPLLSCRIDSQMYYPLSATFENNILTFQFEGNREAKVKVEEKKTHINFELIEFNNPKNVELIVWGRFQLLSIK
ncbi:MAG: hypothetical protein J7L95_03855 [Prolixibacteraceae bacterium]|nr:hypothetical protein [Prolixibacteraceae bacterium]